MIWGDSVHDLGRPSSRYEETQFTIWGDDLKNNFSLTLEMVYLIGRGVFVDSI